MRNEDAGMRADMFLLLFPIGKYARLTARLHHACKVSAASKQPNTGEVSAANEQPGRGPRSGRAVRYSKPPLGRAEQRSSVRIKTLALFERSEFASVPNAASSARDRVSGTDVARLFFGYFLLAKQKKVTRLPGRNPAYPRREKETQQTPIKPFFAYFQQREKERNSAAGPKPGLSPKVNPAQQTP